MKQNLLSSDSGLAPEKVKESFEISIDLQEVVPVRALFRKYFIKPMEDIPHSNLKGGKNRLSILPTFQLNHRFKEAVLF